ncbi:MAG TPA: GLPGLI family protein [Ferruginibacter sp.]|nr:GLPGLI family protein [Ferruginibacter sp.]
MKNKFLFTVCLSFCSITPLLAQQFIDKAVVEYEVKTNVKKTMGNSSFAEMLKDKLPQFKTAYYNLSFANNKSIFKFDHWEPNSTMPEFLRRNDEDNIWYFDYNQGTSSIQKGVFGTMFNIEDSIKHINWKFENENRMIAGFSCRKAVGIIMDSVYVFAFYTDEITIPGGPCSVNGLPGLIMGMTIPRLYTSYIATKVMLNDVNVAAIKPIPSKKPMSFTELKKTFIERTKEWGGGDDEDSKKWIDQLLWNTFL